MKPTAPKKASRAIKKLHYLVDHLAYFYGNNIKFKDVLDLAQSIENTLHSLAVDKKINHAKINEKYKSWYERKLEDEQTIDFSDSLIVEDSVRERYNKDVQPITGSNGLHFIDNVRK